MSNTQELLSLLKQVEAYLTKGIKDECFVGTASEIRMLLVNVRASISKLNSPTR